MSNIGASRFLRLVCVPKIKSWEGNVKSEFRFGHGLKTWFFTPLGYIGTCSVDSVHIDV